MFLIVIAFTSFISAHELKIDNIFWKSYNRLGISKVKNSFGGLTYLRLKRVTNNTFKDFRVYAHFHSKSHDIIFRVKNSEKYERLRRLYNFRTYTYHKANQNLRYHFNQGIGLFMYDKKKSKLTYELGLAYDMSEYLTTSDKTTYLKNSISNDFDMTFINTKLEVEYFHQISNIENQNLSRFEISVETILKINNKLRITCGVLNNIYQNNQKITFSKNKTSLYLSLETQLDLKWTY